MDATQDEVKIQWQTQVWKYDLNATESESAWIKAMEGICEGKELQTQRCSGMEGNRCAV